MNKVVAGALTGCLLGAGVASPTLAENVYDEHNKLVGPVVGKAPDGSTLALMTYNGIKFFAEVSGEGFVQSNVTIYYGQANCQGQTFLAFDVTKELVGTAMFDGSTLWGVDGRRWGNGVMNSRLDGTGCLNFTSETIVPAAQAFQVPGFSPPFLAK
jgi:hypothetical protein